MLQVVRSVVVLGMLLALLVLRDGSAVLAPNDADVDDVVVVALDCPSVWYIAFSLADLHLIVLLCFS